jgi:precorrin-3B C17-methyltransferase
MLYVVGIGPGGPDDRTRRAELAIAASDVIAGYRTYVELIADLVEGKELIATAMTQEVERCDRALGRAAEGVTVALVSSGDPGVYGMAGLAFERADALDIEVPIEIVPGVSAANAAAARLGAPLMLDYACVSLSDLLVPWGQIETRLEALARADLVVALYNPRSHRRVHQLERAVEILLRHRSASTPAGIATAVGLPEEQLRISALGCLLDESITMRSTVIVGNSTTRVIGGRLVTPRGYRP